MAIHMDTFICIQHEPINTAESRISGILADSPLEQVTIIIGTRVVVVWKTRLKNSAGNRIALGLNRFTVSSG